MKAECDLQDGDLLVVQGMFQMKRSNWGGHYDWPIPKSVVLIAGICCIPLLTRGGGAFAPIPKNDQLAKGAL